MRTRRHDRWLPLISLVLLIGVPADFQVVSGQGQGQGQAQGQGELMRRKLDAARKVLEGVALEDFETIGKGARELKEISANSAWNVFPDSDYVHYSRDFRATCDELERQARDRNLDGAALSYVRLTMTCVQCHKFVRLKRP